MANKENNDLEKLLVLCKARSIIDHYEHLGETVSIQQGSIQLQLPRTEMLRYLRRVIRGYERAARMQKER